MRNSQSRRAEIIKKILPYIGSNRYGNHEGLYWVFGAESVWEIVDYLTAPVRDREDDPLEDRMVRLAEELKLHAGRSEAAGRVSLDKPPKFEPQALEGLSADGRKNLQEILLSIQQHQVSIAKKPGKDSEDLVDNLDAKFAEEMLVKLPEAVDRASRLEQLGLETIPNEDVKQYFAEAHHCYLYGFHVACAVLCRAILESALIERCDPQGEINHKGGVAKGYFKALVVEAERKKLLETDRPKAALAVRDAGNDAVHGVKSFNKKWKNRMDETLISTRKVLIDLYAI